MLDIVPVVSAFAVLLVLVALSQPLAARLRLAPVVLLAVIGVSISAASGALLRASVPHWFGAIERLFADLPLGSGTFIYVFLPLLVFEAAMASDVRRILDDAAPILVLAVLATLVAAGVVGVALWPLAGLSLAVCLLLGAVVSTTDPGAVIAIFRDVGAPARLTRLVEGEALLNDAAAIVMFSVLLGMIVSGRELDLGGAAAEFVVSFLGGAALGALAGRAFLLLIPRVHDDRLAEATLTVALAYLSFIAADRAHVSGVVAVLAAGMTVSAYGRSRITPYNWSFIADLWEQLAFWANSLIFLLASILVPKLLVDLRLRDVALLIVLIVAAFAARLLVLFLLLPALSLGRLTQPISKAYKLAIAWGGLRGALTLVLALSVTENPALPHPVQRFVAVLATGLVLFTVLVNGTTLRWIIRFLGLDRLSPVDRLLRDRVLELSYAEMSEIVREIAREHELNPAVEARALAPYQAWSNLTKRNSAVQIDLPERERERVAVSLVALANQERMLVLETLASRAASPNAIEALMRNAQALAEGARSGGRLGYKRAAEAALAYDLSFKVAYSLYRRFGIRRFLAERLGERFEWLLVNRLLIQRLAGETARRSRSIFGKRIETLVDRMLTDRLDQTQSRLNDLRRQYPDYLAALEVRILRQSALRREMERYKALYEEGLIASAVYRNLTSKLEDASDGDPPPRFDIGLGTEGLIARLDLFAGLDPKQLEGLRKLLRARYTEPNELIVRKGERGDAVYFIASGAVEVVLPGGGVPLGTGDFFGEMALITGEPRQADVKAQTYSRLLVLRKSDFERFMRDNPDMRSKIDETAERRLSANRAEAAAAS